MEGSSTSLCSKIGSENRGNLVKGGLRCNHGLKATLDVCKRGENVGKLFVGCPLWKTSNCGYFKWVDDLNKDLVSTMIENGNVAVQTIVGEESNNAKWEAKCHRLKEKKKMLLSENESLKNEFMKLKIERDVSLERERVLCRVLYVSWLLLIVVLIVIGVRKYA